MYKSYLNYYIWIPRLERNSCMLPVTSALRSRARDSLSLLCTTASDSRLTSSLLHHVRYKVRSHVRDPSVRWMRIKPFLCICAREG